MHNPRFQLHIHRRDRARSEPATERSAPDTYAPLESMTPADVDAIAHDFFGPNPPGPVHAILLLAKRQAKQNETARAPTQPRHALVGVPESPDGFAPLCKTDEKAPEGADSPEDISCPECVRIFADELGKAKTKVLSPLYGGSR